MTTDEKTRPAGHRAWFWILPAILLSAAVWLHFRDDSEVAPNPLPLPPRNFAAETRRQEVAKKFRDSIKGINEGRLYLYDTKLTPTRLAQKGLVTAREELAEYAGRLSSAVELMEETRLNLPRPASASLGDYSVVAYKLAMPVLSDASILYSIDQRKEQAVALWEKSGIHRIDSRESLLNFIAGLTLTACKGAEDDALVDLAFADNDTGRIRRMMTMMEANEPERGLFKRTLAGEYEFSKNYSTQLALLYRRQGRLTPFLEWRWPDMKDLGEALENQWYAINSLPNATMNEYAVILARTPDPLPATPAAAKKSFFGRYLVRNCGGSAIVEQMTGKVFDLVADKFDRGAPANHRLRRTALAIRLHELAHGRRPATLAELTPEYLPEIPLDPYDGKPIRYDAAKGWLWSVGRNKTDEHGDEEQDIVFWLPGCEPPDAESPFDQEKGFKAAAAIKAAEEAAAAPKS